MSASPMTEDQREDLFNLALYAFNHAVRRASATEGFDQEFIQQILSSADEFQKDVAEQVLRLLKRHSNYCPIVRETDFFGPIAQVNIPERTEPFSLSNFYLNRRDLVSCEEGFRQRFGISGNTPLEAAPARSYVAVSLKKEISQQELLGEEPELRVSTLADIAYCLLYQGDLPAETLPENQDTVFFLRDRFGEIRPVALSRTPRSWMLYEVSGQVWPPNKRLFIPGQIPARNLTLVAAA